MDWPGCVLFLSPKMDVALSILIIAFYINISTCLYVQSRKKCGEREQFRGCLGLRSERARIDCSTHRELLGGDGSILKLDCDES